MILNFVFNLHDICNKLQYLGSIDKRFKKEIFVKDYIACSPNRVRRPRKNIFKARELENIPM